MRLGHVELDKCYPRFFTPVDVRAMEIIVNGQGCQMNFIRLFEIHLKVLVSLKSLTQQF